MTKEKRITFQPLQRLGNVPNERYVPVGWPGGGMTSQWVALPAVSPFPHHTNANKNRNRVATNVSWRAARSPFILLKGLV